MVNLYRALSILSRATMRRSARPIRQAAGWLTLSVSARRTEDKPLSDDIAAATYADGVRRRGCLLVTGARLLRLSSDKWHKAVSYTHLTLPTIYSV